MHFVSLEWILCLTTTVSLYWLSPARMRDLLLVFISLAFILFFAPLSGAILITLTILCYWGAGPAPSAFRILSVTLVMVFLLAGFKILSVTGERGIVDDIVIPLGLSYYTFRAIHYVLDKFKGSAPAHSFVDFLCYMFFLPTLVIGPINRFDRFQRDKRRKRWDSAMISAGLERILYGYVKITFVANFLLNNLLATYIDGLDPSQQALALYLGMAKTGLNLYFQFAGFSDVAIGFAKLLGYSVGENFNAPYLKKNISDFWSSWHMSLSSWCRDYVYSPVFAASRSPALGALVTMFVIGLWHEISTAYIMWGLFHGGGIFVWQRFQKIRAAHAGLNALMDTKMAAVLSWFLTLHFVWFSFLIVREGGLLPAFRLLADMIRAL